MARRITIWTIFLVMATGMPAILYGQRPKKQVEAFRIEKTPSINGILDEAEWQMAAPAGDFYQYNPYNGAAPHFRTEVRFLYDNKALYIGAMMYDDAPDSILTQMGFRDSHNLNADILNIDISTYNDRLNVVSFGVTASGVQIDVKVTNGDGDRNWNAVWQSKTKVTTAGGWQRSKFPIRHFAFPM